MDTDFSEQRSGITYTFDDCTARSSELVRIYFNQKTNFNESISELKSQTLSLLPIDLIFKIKEFLTDYNNDYNKMVTDKINYFETIPEKTKYSLLLICYGYGAAMVVYNSLDPYPLKKKYGRGINVYAPQPLSFDSFSIIQDFGQFIRGLANELCCYNNKKRYELYVNQYKGKEIKDLPLYEMATVLHFDAVLSKYKHTAYTSYTCFFL